MDLLLAIFPDSWSDAWLLVHRSSTQCPIIVSLALKSSGLSALDMIADRIGQSVLDGVEEYTEHFSLMKFSINNLVNINVVFRKR